jgi:uncharacterized protein YcfJ
MVLCNEHFEQLYRVESELNPAFTTLLQYVSIHEGQSMNHFRHLMILSTAIAATGASFAQDVGRVISSQAVVQQVAVPRQVCSTDQVAVQQQKSGAGALTGAIAGGAVGNAVGRGAGNASATMIGFIGGAALGDRIEGSPGTQTQTVHNCVNQSYFENRTIGYNVVYEFGGKQYSVQMPQDPGPTVQLQVTPVGMQSPPPSPNSAATAQVYQQQPVIESRTVYYTQPYYSQPYYPPVSLNLGFGYWGGRGRWH